MGSLREGLISGLRNRYCSTVRRNEQFWGNFRRIALPTDLRTRGDALIDWVCGDSESTFPPPPFEGGQCPVQYRFQTNNLVTFPNGTTTMLRSGLFVANGPITGLTQQPAPTACGNNNPAAVVLTGDGPVVTGCASGEGASIRAVSFHLLERVDGQPDVCGDPPPDLPPPGDIVTNVDITYGPNNEFNLTVPVVFAPIYVSLDGRVNAPVSIELFPNLTLNGTLELFPNFDLDVNFPSSRDPGTDGPEGEPPPQLPPGDGQGDDDEGEPPPERDDLIYAVFCRCRIESDAPPSGIFQEVGPDIYVPRLGSVRFGTQVQGVTFWSEDMDIKGLNSVVQCPIPWGATRYTVNAAPGVAINFTPIFTRPKEWPPYLALGFEGTSDNR